MKTILIAKLILVGVFLFSLASCTAKQGPAFEGSLVVGIRSYEAGSKGDQVYEIAKNTASGKIEANLLADAVIYAAVSPDAKYLLYVSAETISLLDLTTKEDRVLINSTTKCLSWSPDSSHFSVVLLGERYGLYSSDLGGVLQTVMVGRTAKYEQFGKSGKTTVTAELGCGFWIDANHLAFDYYAGDFPQTLESHDSPITLLSANTTRITRITPLETVKELNAVYQYIDSCPKDSQLLLLDTSGAAAKTLIVTYDAGINLEMTTFQSCPDCREDIGFLPDCSIYYGKNAPDKAYHLYTQQAGASEAQMGTKITVRGSI